MKRASLFIIGSILLSACVPSGSSPMGHGNMNHGGMNTGGAMMQESFLPASDKDVGDLPAVRSSEILQVSDGDTITLSPQLVRASIGGKEFAMYAYNGQFPGPTIKVAQGSTFTVNVKNNIDQPTTIHWHGIRLDNKFDGAAGVTQEAILPGDSFTYTVTVPDEGMFWYHPHVREDLQQDMGLYGLLHVIPKQGGLYGDVDREETVVLDDMLLEGGLPVPYGEREANHALMGRFGNTLLVNGAKPRPLDVGLGSVVRFSFLNASNTRTYRIVKPSGSTLKIVGGDAGRVEHQYMADSVILSPSERLIAEVYFWDNGVNTGGTDSRTVTLVETGEPSDPVAAYSARIIGGVVGQDRSKDFMALQKNADVVADVDAYRTFFDKPVDKTIHLSVEQNMMGGMMMDHGGGDVIEWDDPMPMMNAMATKENTQWKLVDEESGDKNMDIAYEFKRGDKVKIRLVNDTMEDGSAHAMQHPIHFHGQRFLVLSVDGKSNENLVWKDTVLVGKKQTVDILLDVTNPGDWMIHCHIAEHLSNGMMSQFHVE